MGLQTSQKKDLAGLTLDVVKTGDEEQFAALVNEAFGVKQGNFLDDFPVWRNGLVKASIRMGVFADKRRLAATSCIRLAFLKTRNGKDRLPVAIIGAVTTHANYRSRGLASRLVAQCMKWAAQNGAAVVFLWGSEHKLYQNLGFELCGSQIQVPLKELTLSKGKEPMQEGWSHSLFCQQAQRTSGLDIFRDDEKWYSEHKGTRWFWSGLIQKPSAFLGYGRGIDLQGLVHEWGGSPVALKSLLAWFRDKFPAARILGHPAKLKEYFGKVKGSLEYLCMAHVIGPETVAKHLMPGRKFAAKLDDKGLWNISVDGNKPFRLSEIDLPKFFFGPEQFEGIEIKGLPLPLWLWGLDAA